MHRLIVTTLLLLHLFVMTLVAAFNAKFSLLNGGMLAAAAFLLCQVQLLLYIRKRAFPAIVLACLGLYLALMVLAYLALVIGSVQIGKASNILFHSVVFMPGIYCTMFYIKYVVTDRKQAEK